VRGGERALHDKSHCRTAVRPGEEEGIGSGQQLRREHFVGGGTNRGSGTDRPRKAEKKKNEERKRGGGLIKEAEERGR